MYLLYLINTDVEKTNFLLSQKLLEKLRILLVDNCANKPY